MCLRHWFCVRTIKNKRNKRKNPRRSGAIHEHALNILYFLNKENQNDLSGIKNGKKIDVLSNK